MKTSIRYEITKIGFLALLAFAICFIAKAYAGEHMMKSTKTETIVLAGGCFWGVEAVFEHTKGVVDAVSGYAGGKADTAQYDAVSSGTTGHAEAVKITYDPTKISLDTLLDIYFNVAHNPTQLNYQGPDHGTQYRSAIFYAGDEQKKEAENKITVLDKNYVFSDPIVTKLEKIEQFYPAEEYHQNYAALHPMQPYIVIHDAPKVAKLKSLYPDLYKEQK